MPASSAGPGQQKERAEGRPLLLVATHALCARVPHTKGVQMCILQAQLWPARLCSFVMATARDSGDDMCLNKTHSTHIPSR